MSDSNQSKSTLGQAIEKVGDAVGDRLNVPDILKHVEGYAAERLPGLRELIPDAIQKLEDHMTLESYHKLVAEIEELGSDASKLTEKVVDAMWKKLKQKNQGIIGSLMGLFDGTGKWILRKLVDMGIVGNDMVKKFKDQAADFLSDAKGKLAGVATMAGAGAALGKLKDGLSGSIEEGKEFVSVKFEKIRDQAHEILQEYKELAEEMHITGAVQAIGQVAERMGKLTYETISEGGRIALKEFLENPAVENAPHVLSILVAEIKDLEHLQVVEEMRAFRISDPKEKAKFVSSNGFLRLRDALKEKGVDETKQHEKGIDALMREMEGTDYASIPVEKWQALKSAVEGCGTGIEVRNDSGFYHCVDYTEGFGNFVIGFSPDKPGKEISAMPPMYFGQVGLLELRGRLEEGWDSFFTPLKKVFEERSHESREALEEIERDVKAGKTSFADLVLHPKSSKMGKLFLAMARDSNAGNLALGIGEGTIAVGGSVGWYVIKTSWAAPLRAVFAEAVPELVKQGDLAAAGRAGLVEYLKVVSPFMTFFGGVNLFKRIMNPDELFDPSTLGQVAMGAAAGFYLPFKVIMVTGKLGLSFGHGLARTLNLKSMGDAYDLTRLRYRYHTNWNLMEKAPTRLRKTLRGDFWNAPNLTRMENIGTKLRELAYLEEMQKHMRIQRVHYLDYHHRANDVSHAMWDEINAYVRRNFSGTVGKEAIEGIENGLLEQMKVENGRVWLSGEYLERLQAKLDILIMQKGHVTKILGETLADADELRELKELEDKAHDPIRQARIAALEAAQSAPKSVSDTISSLSQDFEDEMKKAKPDKMKLRKILADLVAQEDKAVSHIGGNLNSMRSELAADVGLGRQAMLEAAHANEQVGDLVAKRSARVKALLALDSGFAAEAKTVMEATDGLCESYRSRITLLAKSITEDYKKLKGAAKSAGTEREFVDAYKRLMTGHSGGNVMTRLFRSAGGRLKFGVLLAGAMAGVMGTFEAMKDDKDASKRDFFAFLYEQGPQMLDIIISVLPIVGFTADFSAAWKGKNVITGQDLTTGERWGKVAWGVTGLAGDALTVLGLATSWTGIGAGVAGGGVASKIAAAALRFGLKAPQAAKLGTRLAEFLMRFGPKQVMLMLEEYRSATTLAAKAAMATRAVHKVGLAVAVTQEAGRLVYGLLDDDPGFQAPAEALADLKEAPGIASFPSEAKVEHMKKAA